MLANSIIVRSICGIGAILFCFVAAEWTGAGYDFEIVAPSLSLEDLPIRFGAWEGTEIPLETGTQDVLGAEAFVNRSYQNGEAVQVGVHLAYWASPKYVADVAPHHPRVCYNGAGWELLEVRRIAIDTETGKLPLEVMLLQRNDQQIVTAHWYQMGEFRFTDRSDARGVHRQLWGKPKWPATLKVLLQAGNARDIDSALPGLKELAAKVSDWTAGFQQQPDSPD